MSESPLFPGNSFAADWAVAGDQLNCGGHDMNSSRTTRRDILAGAATLAAASTIGTQSGLAAPASVGGINAIPELAAQWKKLDLAEILSRPAAFMSVSQNKSLYESWGAQASEKHRERGSLPATVKVVQAARNAKNFISFNWIG